MANLVLHLILENFIYICHTWFNLLSNMLRVDKQSFAACWGLLSVHQLWVNSKWRLMSIIPCMISHRSGIGRVLVGRLFMICSWSEVVTGVLTPKRLYWWVLFQKFQVEVLSAIWSYCLRNFFWHVNFINLVLRYGILFEVCNMCCSVQSNSSVFSFII